MALFDIPGLFHRTFFLQPASVDVTPQLIGTDSTPVIVNVVSLPAETFLPAVPIPAVPVSLLDGIVYNYNTNNYVGSTTATTPVSYNTVKQHELTNGQSLTLAASTVHSISYKVMSGTCTVQIGSDIATYMAGEADSETATATFGQAYTITAGANSKIRVKLITA